MYTTPPAPCVVWRNSWITYNLVQVWAFGLDCFTTNYYLCAAPRPGANVPRAACNVEAAAQRAEHAQGTRRVHKEYKSSTRNKAWSGRVADGAAAVAIAWGAACTLSTHGGIRVLTGYS